MAGDRSAQGGRPPVAVEGVVVEALPHAMYRVVLDSRRRVLAHAGRGTGRNFVRVIVGDRVLVELSPVDRSRGRIARRLEKAT
jgi:translation initiation factor IF-1